MGALEVALPAVSGSGQVARIAHTAVLGLGVKPSPVPEPHSFQNPASGIRMKDSRAAPLWPITQRRVGRVAKRNRDAVLQGCGVDGGLGGMCQNSRKVLAVSAKQNGRYFSTESQSCKLNWTVNRDVLLTYAESLPRALPPISSADAPVIGVGLGGRAAAMRRGAKGYRVTMIDRLDMPGGRESSITQAGHRFDLGPTIVTVPQGLRDLRAACGRDFDRDVDLRELDPFCEIRWEDGSRFTAGNRPRRCGRKWRGFRPPICRATIGFCRTASGGTGSRIWSGGRCTGLPTC